MLNFNEDDLKASIIEKAADEILTDGHNLTAMIEKEVKKRLDNIFSERVEAQVKDAIDKAIENGFDREYQRVNAWGEPEGGKTSIRKQLDKVVNGYWSAKVDSRSGKDTSDSYSAITRAEYFMTKICAEDFSKNIQQHASNVTGALKDGLRIQLAAQMDTMLDGLFRIKSLQDQGKVEKPW